MTELLGNDLALIDAGGANLGSVRYALGRIGASPRLVRDADELGEPTRIILPGVGAAAPSMALLRARGLDVALRASEVPLLGVCVGMQLLFESSEEGDVDCLGLLKGRVRKLPGGPGLRVPHMGWNRLQKRADANGDTSPLLKGKEGKLKPGTGEITAAVERLRKVMDEASDNYRTSEGKLKK